MKAPMKNNLSRAQNLLLMIISFLCISGLTLSATETVTLKHGGEPRGDNPWVFCWDSGKIPFEAEGSFNDDDVTWTVETTGGVLFHGGNNEGSSFTVSNSGGTIEFNIEFSEADAGSSYELSVNIQNSDASDADTVIVINPPVVKMRLPTGPNLSTKKKEDKNQLKGFIDFNTDDDDLDGELDDDPDQLLYYSEVAKDALINNAGQVDVRGKVTSRVDDEIAILTIDEEEFLLPADLNGEREPRDITLIFDSGGGKGVLRVGNLDDNDDGIYDKNVFTEKEITNLSDSTAPDNDVTEFELKMKQVGAQITVDKDIFEGGPDPDENRKAVLFLDSNKPSENAPGSVDNFKNIQIRANMEGCKTSSEDAIKVTSVGIRPVGFQDPETNDGRDDNEDDQQPLQHLMVAHWHGGFNGDVAEESVGTIDGDDVEVEPDMIDEDVERLKISILDAASQNQNSVTTDHIKTFARNTFPFENSPQGVDIIQQFDSLNDNAGSQSDHRFASEVRILAADEQIPNAEPIGQLDDEFANDNSPSTDLDGTDDRIGEAANDGSDKSLRAEAGGTAKLKYTVDGYTFNPVYSINERRWIDQDGNNEKDKIQNETMFFTVRPVWVDHPDNNADAGDIIGALERVNDRYAQVGMFARVITNNGTKEVGQLSENDIIRFNQDSTDNIPDIPERTMLTVSQQDGNKAKVEYNIGFEINGTDVGLNGADEPTISITDQDGGAPIDIKPDEAAQQIATAINGHDDFQVDDKAPGDGNLIFENIQETDANGKSADVLVQDNDGGFVDIERIIVEFEDLAGTNQEQDTDAGDTIAVDGEDTDGDGMADLFMNVATPSNADWMSDGNDGLEEFGGSDGNAGTIEERTAIRTLHDSNNETIDVIFITSFSSGDTYGEAFSEDDSFNAGLDTIENHVFVEDKAVLPQSEVNAGEDAELGEYTTAHEIGHVVTDAGHFGGDHRLMTQSALTLDGFRIDRAKRLTGVEWNRILDNSGPDNPDNAIEMLNRISE